MPTLVENLLNEIDSLEEMLDEAEDISLSLARIMDMALVAAPNAAPFITEEANKITEELRMFCGRNSRYRSDPDRASRLRDSTS